MDQGSAIMSLLMNFMKGSTGLRALKGSGLVF